MKQNIKDGSYTAEVTLTGGSSKSYVQSPARLEVENGKITAEIVWNSPNYDYMEVSGTAYYPVNSEGNSTFLIEIPALDTNVDLLAETVAMSKPHMIEYTLNFDSATLKAANSSGGIILFSAAVFLAALISGVAVAAKRRKKINEKNN